MIIKHILLALTVVTAVGIGTSQAAGDTPLDQGAKVALAGHGDKLVSSSAQPAPEA